MTAAVLVGMAQLGEGLEEGTADAHARNTPIRGHRRDPLARHMPERAMRIL